MPRILLYSSCQPAGQSGFDRAEGIWDTETRRFSQRISQELACQVYEIPADTIVDQWCDLAGNLITLRPFVFGVSTDPFWPQDDELTPLVYTIEANSSQCPIPATLTLGRVALTQPSAAGATDGRIVFDTYTPNPPLTLVLSNGQLQTISTAAGVAAFENLPTGTYGVQAEDAAGATASLSSLRLLPAPAATEGIWLYYFVYQNLDPDNWLIDYQTAGTQWNPRTKTVDEFNTTDGPPTLPTPPETTVVYDRPVTELVDSYYLPGGVIFRRVYPDGARGVRFVDERPSTLVDVATLRVENLILQHVHQPTVGSGVARGEAVGSVLIEARSPAVGTLSFALTATDAVPAQTNATGRFTDLPAGPYQVRVTDSGGQTVLVPFTVEDRYRSRFYHEAFTSQGALVRVDILGRDFGGDPETVDCTAEGVQRSWSAEGASLEGQLPEASGQSATLTLRATYLGQLSPLKVGADDRSHRVDIHVGGQLMFRGYVLPDLYEEDLRHALGGDITMMAADGLGGLRDTNFLNHESLPLAGRWPLINTLLHCLSRCECGPLPLHVQTGLRESMMAEGDELMGVLYSDREGYRETGENGREWTCRQVVDAILAVAHATLTQREGAWWVSSANAAPDREAFTAYSPVGALLGAQAAPAVVQHKPAGFVSGQLHWVNAQQRLQVLAAVRAVPVRTKLLLVQNQLTDGLLQVWQSDLLKPLGWSGTLNVSRLEQSSEDAKPLAGQTKLRISGEQPGAAAQLLSPAIAFRHGFDETPVRVQIRCRVVVLSAPDPAAAIPVRVRAVASVNGTALAPELRWEVGSQEKEVTVEAYVPFGQARQSGSLRVALLAPQLLDATPGVRVALDVYEVVLRIEPGAVSWPEQDEVVADSETGFLVLPEVNVHHADLPRLPLPDGTPRPAVAMDALAWRHALTYADGTPTTLWRRTYSTQAAPLLQTVGYDRLDLRRGDVSVLVGEVKGQPSAVAALGFGTLVQASDAPSELLWCVGADINELKARATVTLREIGAAAPVALPSNRLITDRGEAVITDEGHTLVWV